MHSIFMLRLFNDPIAMLLFYAAMYSFIRQKVRVYRYLKCSSFAVVFGQCFIQLGSVDKNEHIAICARTALLVYPIVWIKTNHTVFKCVCWHSTLARCSILAYTLDALYEKSV